MNLKGRVGVILINYNSAIDTIDCVESIKTSRYKDIKIYVVDNMSIDNSCEVIESSLKSIVLLKSKKNLGWSGGNNIGIQEAIKDGMDYLLVLNNDTIVEEDTIEKLVNTAKRYENTAIIGCKINYFSSKDIIWFAGGRIDWHKFLVHNVGNGLKDTKQYSRCYETEYITGCCMLIPRNIISACGLFPEEYFMYFEDVDYSVRCLKKGCKLIIDGNATIYHKVSASTGGEESPFSILWISKNRWRFFKRYKNMAEINYVLSAVHIFMSHSKNILKFIVKKDKDRLSAMIKGLKEGVIAK